MTRALLRAVCRGLIGALLLAQMAIAAYACPALSSAAGVDVRLSTTGSSGGDPSDASVVPAADRAMNCADMAGSMDPSFANLCAEHCHYGQQSDQVPTVTVPAALLVALYITPPVPETAVPSRPAAAVPGALAAASPPHAILHCCFRI